MAIQFKRDTQGLVVLKHDQVAASIRKSTPADVGHRHSEPWMLIHASGRIDRHATQGDARNDAMKL